ncbi:MAG: 50S ribosomal protein L11 methyltransferase, partial [Verrucomicrobiia bacterium]
GHHATTAYCLDEIVRLRCSSKPAAFLDVGTGSGILAIAAAKLGYKPVRAIDIDPEAVRYALANARHNKVQRLIEFSAVGLADLEPDSCRTYGVVCANLSDDVLLKEHRRLAKLVGHASRLVVSGILRKDFARVLNSYEALGFALERSRTNGEWRSATLVLRDA